MGLDLGLTRSGQFSPVTPPPKKKTLRLCVFALKSFLSFLQVRPDEIRHQRTQVVELRGVVDAVA